MKQVQIGSSGLTTSQLGLGCMGMSEYYGPIDTNEAKCTLERALDLGVFHFDTADVYGRGANEDLIGGFLSSITKKDSSLVIATKFGLDRKDVYHSRYVNGTPEYTRAACELSLQRLGIDTIDLYYVHRIDPLVPIEETVGELGRLVREGKVRALGLSEVSPQILRRAHREHPISAVQTEYSLWCREVELEVLPLCRELGIALVAYSPLGKGILAGTIKNPSVLASDDYRKSLPRFQDEVFKQNLGLLAPLYQIAAQHSCKPAQVAIAWLLAQGDDVLPIPGTKRRKYLEENVGAVDIVLTSEELKSLSDFYLEHVPFGERYGEAAMKTIRAGKQ